MYMMKTATMNIRTKIVTALTLGIVLILGVSVVLYSNNTKPVQTESEVIFFDVVEGDSLGSVLSRLEEENLIKSAFFTKYKAKFINKGEVFVGTFALDKSWTSEEILDYLSHASYGAVEAEVFLVEGSWAKDMAKEISETIAVSEERLLELWNDKAYIQTLIDKYEVLPSELLDNTVARVLLEGYLYPDTYRFYVRATEEDVTERLVSNANDKYLTYKDRMPENMSPYELMTLASIVEYEASTDEDMRLVAGVFYNRLDAGMMLQSSVTVCYALYEFDKWEECEQNPELDNPYNTYMNEGLPPGPILNPSVRAIEATLDYTESSYLFFIADVHNVVDGRVHYQTTYDEHVQDRILLLGY